MEKFIRGDKEDAISLVMAIKTTQNSQDRSRTLIKPSLLIYLALEVRSILTVWQSIKMVIYIHGELVIRESSVIMSNGITQIPLMKLYQRRSVYHSKSRNVVEEGFIQ